MKPRVVFSDFDGTITERDVIVMILERFGAPDWKELTQQILDGQLSIRDGVRQLFEKIPGRYRPDIERFVEQTVEFRPGFQGFVRQCRLQNIPLVVVSGGIDFFVEPVLRRLPPQDFAHLQLFCNQAVFHPDRIEVLNPHQNRDCTACLPMPAGCGCCKVGVMAAWPPTQYERIAIGDSVTDIAMAQAADRVFARERLIDYCEHHGIACERFNTFEDIANACFLKNY